MDYQRLQRMEWIIIEPIYEFRYQIRLWDTMEHACADIERASRDSQQQHIIRFSRTDFQALRGGMSLEEAREHYRDNIVIVVRTLDLSVYESEKRKRIPISGREINAINAMKLEATDRLVEQFGWFASISVGALIREALEKDEIGFKRQVIGVFPDLETKLFAL